MRIPDPEALAHADARLGDVQVALDDVRQVLRGAAQVERTAQKGMRVLRTVGVAAIGLALIVVAASALRRRHAE